LRHLLSARHILESNRPQFNLSRTELLISCLQLDELLPTGTSGLPAIKHQDNARPTAHIGQANDLPILSLKTKVRRHCRGT